MKLLSILSTLVVFALAQNAQDAGLTVNTQQGPVVGTQILPTVRQFLGIPFATAGRWQPPKLPAVRKSVFQAAKFANGCFQNLSPPNAGYLMLNGNGGLNVSTGEDCLAVNIWSPSTDRKQKTAVLVWIYGGGFVFGTSGIPVFEGTNMVRDNNDITLVTLNYRLNIFGQPNAPQLSAKENLNFGLLDIEAAIQWVHTNIASFGGDPNRITIFGQSAGGAAVDAYTFAHPHDTIVKGVIEQSGSVSGNTTLNGIPGDHTDWDTVASSVGCGNATTPEQFTCMQGISAPILEKAVISTGAGFSLIVDNVTMFRDTQTRAENGQFLRVPLLIGSTANEDDIFEVAAQLVTTGVALPVLTELFSDALTPLFGGCPSALTAVHRLNVNVPTFRYQYQGVFRSLSTRPDLRAYHSSEIPMIFGTYNGTVVNGASFAASPDQIMLSKYIQSAWVGFARDPSQGLPKLGWPLYNPNTTTLAQLGNFFNTSGVVFGQSALIDAACNHQDILGQILAQVGPLLT